ncbi:unnamed protein product [Schistosoma turkestanicum]|nr:unnamed protein product [Schistosoma turkestanicum]
MTFLAAAAPSTASPAFAPIPLPMPKPAFAPIPLPMPKPPFAPNTPPMPKPVPTPTSPISTPESTASENAKSWLMQ